MTHSFVLFDALAAARYNTFMLSILAAPAGIGILLILSELLWRKHVIRGEYGRKFVHIFSGLYIASWPFFMTMQAIQILAVAALFVILLSRHFKVFHAIHDIKRMTAGEILYPVGVFIAAGLSHANWVFSVAILFVALADGMAAVIGKKYGTKKGSYHIFGAKKTLLGSVAYIIFAYSAVLIGYFIGGKQTMLAAPFAIFLLLPLLCTLLEAVSVYGTDNITAPLAVVVILNMLLARV